MLGEGREISFGVCGMRRASRRSPCVVDEDVNGGTVHHTAGGRGNSIRLREICHCGGMPIPGKSFYGGFQALGIAGHEGAFGPQFSQLLGRRQTDSLGCPTNEGVFSFQVESHRRKVPPYLRPMLTGIQHLHGALRWVVLILMLLSIIKAFSGMSGGRSFGKGDYKRGLFTMIALHLQLVLGFALYFGKGWSSKLGNAEAMGNAVMRFFSLEHMVTMLFAVILGTLGHSLSKRAADDRTKFRRQAIWFTVSLVLILSSIPWPFRPGFEAYGWW